MRRRIVSAKPATAHRMRHSIANNIGKKPSPNKIEGSGSSAAIDVRKKAIAMTGRPASSSQAVYFASFRPRIRREACSNQKTPTQRGSR